MTEEMIYTQADMDDMLARQVPTQLGLSKRIDGNNRVFFVVYAMVGYRHVSTNVGVTFASEAGTVIGRDVQTGHVLVYFPHGEPDLEPAELQKRFRHFLCLDEPKIKGIGTRRIMDGKRTAALKVMKEHGYDIIYQKGTAADTVKFILSKNGVEKDHHIVAARHLAKWGIMK